MTHNIKHINIPANTIRVLTDEDLSSANLEITLAEHAKVIQYQIIDTPTDIVQKIIVNQHANSHYEQHYINLQAPKVQRDISVNLLEPRANCVLTGMYVAKNHELVENNIKIFHYAKNCHSLQDYRGVLLDSAAVELQSLVNVAANANLTNAKQHSKHLIASNRANIKVSPSLEIFHDDVVCAHGASIGELDANMIFYLQSRGLNYDEARALIIKGFITSQLTYITDDAMRNNINTVIEKHWFGHILEIEA